MRHDFQHELAVSACVHACVSACELSSFPILVVPENFSDERGRLKDDLTHKYLYEVEHTLSSAVLGFTGSKIFGFCSQVPYICSYVMPVKVRQPPAVKTEVPLDEILLAALADSVSQQIASLEQ